MRRFIRQLSATPADPRTLIALSVIVLFAFVALIAMSTPGADVFDRLLVVLGGLLRVIVRAYFHPQGR